MKIYMVSLLHRATIIMKKLKPRNRDAQKKRSGREVCGISPEAGRENMVGKICERGRSCGGRERKRELWRQRQRGIAALRM